MNVKLPHFFSTERSTTDENGMTDRVQYRSLLTSAIRVAIIFLRITIPHGNTKFSTLFGKLNSFSSCLFIR